MLFQIPRQAEAIGMVPFFEKFECVKTELKVDEYSLGLSTLEEVFLNLSNEADFISQDAIQQDIVKVEIPEEAKPKKAQKVALKAQFSALFKKSYRY